jgi:dienelactone hydrolase
VSRKLALPAALAALLCVIPAASSHPQTAKGVSAVPSFPELRKQFAYDRQPLTVIEHGVEQRGSVAVHDITFGVPGEDQIDAFLVVPSGKGPFAGILFAHWLGLPHNDRTEFLDEAVAVARHGAVALLPMGDLPWVPDPVGDASDKSRIIYDVIRHRRALDLLTAQPGVDPKRIAVVGHDYGAMYGALLSAVDRRVSAEVLMALDSTFSNWFATYWLGYTGEQLAAYQQLLVPVDPINYVGHAPAGGVLLQFSGHDQYVPESVRGALIAATSEPKEALVYANAGHHLNGAARRDRDAWLIEHLGLAG